ncbi:unnamed protein product [Ceratitis capitata]|uniref:(Mediterranean fruit fly) hypothetical protein n=1 Tax=Ceratitis capitata TaxID=7213 RepID=A0A811UD50_CERCA|nr:unnamed protein product [Ceratitis capitata]
MTFSSIKDNIFVCCLLHTTVKLRDFITKFVFITKKALKRKKKKKTFLAIYSHFHSHTLETKMLKENFFTTAWFKMRIPNFLKPGNMETKEDQNLSEILFE